MIDLYYWPTPNGRKISIMLEECALEYNAIPVNIGQGDQFQPEFLKISPNNRMPAIVDHETGISMFEGGSILLYLAEKTGKFMPGDQRGRFNVMQWLFWQAGGLGPMAGQLSHFASYCKVPVPYAHDRYANEYDRLLGVMEVQLRQSEYLAGDYSIADIASYPWIMPHERLGNDLSKFPNVRRWFDAIADRPAVRLGSDVGKEWRRGGRKSAAVQSAMFGQTSATVFAAAEEPKK
jgi:GST-like protein